MPAVAFPLRRRQQQVLAFSVFAPQLNPTSYAKSKSPILMAPNSTGEEDSWLVVDEVTATELSKLLDSAPLPTKVMFTDDPYSSLAAVQSSSAYFTIDVNEESCGSSFSDSDSSVMVSFDVGGWRSRGAWGFDCAEARDWFRGWAADVEEIGGEDAMWEEFLDQVLG